MLKETIGSYSIIEKAGEGAYGTVWKVCNEEDNKVYAIKEVSKKRITPELLNRLIQEVQISFNLSHDHIVKCFNTLESKTNYYIIFEYCIGGDLGHYLEKFKRIDIRDALHIMKQIKDAYKYLLNQNVLHRDIKLENILISNLEEMTVKISDFGCSKVDMLGSTICGTPKYMALEVMESDGNYDYKADFWSIGLVFWELLFGFGSFPFSQKSKEALKNDIKRYSGPNLRFPSFPVYPSDFYDFLKRMLNVSPKLRLESDEFINHSIFKYEGTEPEILNGLKVLNNPLNDGQTELVEAYDMLKLSHITNSGNGSKNENELTLTKSDDPSNKVMIFADIKKVYTVKVLEVNLIKSVVEGLIDTVQPHWSKEFHSYYSCLSIILLKKAISKAEMILRTLEKGINTFKLDGFMQFWECPNEYILIKEELQDLTVALKKIDDEIYAGLLDYCYSPEFLEEINKYFYLKAEAEGKTKFISSVWKYIFCNYKQKVPDYEMTKFEKILQRISIILKGKVTENLSVFY